VAGFATGDYDGLLRKYRVPAKAAHAWVEVYFPTYGWIEFEPTGNQGALERRLVDPTPEPSNAPALPLITNRREPLSERDEEGGGASSSDTTTRRPVNPYLLAAIIIAALVIGGLYAERKYSLARQLPGYISRVYARNNLQPPQWINNWAQWTELSSIERSFQAINISLGWLGASQPVHATPQQRAGKLGELLPKARDAIEVLEAEHRAELFTTVPGQPSRARRAGFVILWQAIRKRALRFLGYNYGQSSDPDHTGKKSRN
jgi:hypothetical protein